MRWTQRLLEKLPIERIKFYVSKKYHRKASNLYVLQITCKYGLEVGRNYNLSKYKNLKVRKYLSEKEEVIMDGNNFRLVREKSEIEKSGKLVSTSI